MKHVIWIMLLLALASSLQASQSDIKPVVFVKAAYIPMDNHANCEGICDKFRVPETGMVFSLEKICKWDDIPSLITSDNIEMVFVMCPTAAKKLFIPPGFQVDNTLKADLDKLANPNKNSAENIPEKVKRSKISEKLNQIIDIRLKIIRRYAQDPLVINAVRKANANDVSLDQIKELDLKWMNDKEFSFSKNILSSDISRFLRKKILSNKLLYTEAFLCDQQGATLGAYPRTSDYWQGDEDKFTECFSNAQTYIGPLEFDESTKSYAVQVSEPVMESGKVIGVLVVGLRNIK